MIAAFAFCALVISITILAGGPAVLGVAIAAGLLLVILAWGEVER